MTAPELKPCPFCGGKARSENYVIEAAVRCLDCRCCVARRHTSIKCEGYDEAIAAWNTRADTATWNAAIRAAAEAATYVIQNIDILKADGETYETPRVQKVARGLVDVARQDILALLKEEPNAPQGTE